MPYGDDNQFIFDSFLQYVDSIFSFWNPKSNFFKSWPLSYSVLTVMFNTFEQNVIPYRILNLILHLGNSFLFLSFLKKIKPSGKDGGYFIVFLLFLIHPISYFTHNWIFQIKTLLCMFFTLLFLNLIERKKKDDNLIELGAFTSFILAINSKIACVLLPFYLLTKRENYKTRIGHLSITAIYFLVSGYYGLVNVKGIDSFFEEKTRASQSIVEYPNSGKVSEDEPDGPELKSYVGVPFKEQLRHSLQNLGGQFTKLESLREKSLLSLFTFGRYMASTVGISTFALLYESNYESLNIYNFVVFPLMGFLFLLFSFSKDRIKETGLLLIFFIPVSGLFYIPYMKYSYISHHWFYMALPFALTLIIFDRSKWVKLIVCSSICTHFLVTSFNLTSTEKAIDYSLNKVKNPLLFAYKMETFEKQKRYEGGHKMAQMLAMANGEDTPITTKTKLRMSIEGPLDNSLVRDLREYLNFLISTDKEIKASIFLDKLGKALSYEERVLYRAMLQTKIRKNSKSNLEKVHEIFFSTK
ncbi:MAG: hypothetical protein CME64_15500 [Halobacteriovoraceae bacterium]|nr:hypothetical protein [Halobacteriovoraceae bacterium]